MFSLFLSLFTVQHLNAFLHQGKRLNYLTNRINTILPNFEVPTITTTTVHYSSRNEIFFEDFDSSDEIPNGWDPAGLILVDPGYGLNGTNALCFVTFPAFGFDLAAATSPSIANIPQGASLEFYYRIMDGDNDTYTAEIGALTFAVRIDNQPLMVINNTNHHTIDYTPIVVSLNNYANRSIEIQFLMSDAVHGYIVEVDNFRVFTSSSAVSIAGIIIDSITEEGLEGALVSLNSTENHLDCTTDATGAFILNNVLTNTTYTLTVSKDGYDNYVNNSLVVGDNDLIIPTISLQSNVSVNDNPTQPFARYLGANYPNPFNPSTTISFTNIQDGQITIEIFNIQGQKVQTLVNDFYKAGQYQVTWHGTDVQNHNVGSGVYFYQMKSDSFTQTRKMILMK